MAVCGHQFHKEDETDWILSTSASCVGGSSTAKQILQDLFRQTVSNKTKCEKRVAVLTSRNYLPKNHSRSTENPPTVAKTENDHMIVTRIPGSYFENFDESQHLNGCPMKWLYNKRLLEKNKVYKVARLCSKKPEKDEIKREKKKNLRDKTPVEVKIHKINLIDKYTSEGDENYISSLKSLDKTDASSELEAQRKKLAAKLNWKLHDDSQDDCPFETSSEISSRLNYLPPRPLLGLKPLLSILLAPQQESVCCSVRSQLKGDPVREEKVKPSLSIQSLDLPLFSSEEKPRPRTTHTPRWGGKSSRLQKQLQIPNQVTIDLRHASKPTSTILDVKSKPYACSSVKKFQAKEKRQKSLSTLFYELKDKTHYRSNSQDYFEEIIRDLTMGEEQFKIKRFFNYNTNIPLLQKIKNGERKPEIVSSGKKESNLVCGRVKFFQKLPESKPKRVASNYSAKVKEP